jgi:hypothetical protein
MAILLVKLIPYMNNNIVNSNLNASAQDFSLNNICSLCTITSKNVIQSCKSSILNAFIYLLNEHKKLSHKNMEKLFETIQILGLCSINNVELKSFLELLQPRKQFPYGIHVLRCLLCWSKHTSSIGFNLSQMNYSTNDVNTESERTNLNTLNETSSISKNNYLSVETNSAINSRLRRGSVITINQNLINNMMKTTGALAQTASQQAKYFFDFQHPNSGIRIPPVKKWPGYAFTFHAWIKLKTDLEKFEKKRRQLYSFYNDYGQGFEAFFTSDCSSLVISTCTKKEFLSFQLKELNFYSSNNQTPSDSNAQHLNTNDMWHSLSIVQLPAKGPFGQAHLFVYIDGVLKKEIEFKMPNFNDTFNHVRIGAVCSRPLQSLGQNSYLSISPLSNLKNVFSLRGNSTEKVFLKIFSPSSP